MSRHVVWTEHALDDVKRLDAQVGKRVFAAVARFAAVGHGDVKRLHGKDAEWRLRVGDWRVRYTVDGESQTMIVLQVLPRGRAYRR